MDENKILIKIKIADKIYPLWIDRKEEEEELARNAAKQIDMKYKRCRAEYSKSLDEKDLLAMVAFKLSKDNLLLEKQNDPAPFVEKIQKVTKQLEMYLDKN